jgi:hypothetical protein
MLDALAAPRPGTNSAVLSTSPSTRKGVALAPHLTPRATAPDGTCLALLWWMNPKESPQSPTANGLGQFPAPPSGEESEPKSDAKAWSPQQPAAEDKGSDPDTSKD